MTLKIQWGVFLFLNRVFHSFVLTKFPLSLFNTLPCPYLTTVISISNDSLTFLPDYLFLIERVFGYSQSKRPWHSFKCLVASYLWCSLVGALLIYHWFSFCSTIIYWLAWTFNLYNPGWLFGINLSLFLHEIFFKLGKPLFKKMKTFHWNCGGFVL